MSYIILSPGRCASVQLATYLKNYLHSSFSHVVNSTKITDLLNLNIIHCHSKKIALPYLNHKKLIVITRNPLEIAASMLVAEQTKVFHFTEITIEDYIEKYKNVEFLLNPKIFSDRIKDICDWYINIQPLMNNATILTYHQAINIPEVCNILGIKFDPQCKLHMAMKPQPFNKWDKIKSSNDLITLGNSVFKKYQILYPLLFDNRFLNIEPQV